MTREHRGYSDMLYYLLHLKEKRDIFLNVLIFKVSVISPPHNSIGIFSTNSVLDHIPKELEIFVIEYCLIYYFKSSIQKVIWILLGVSLLITLGISRKKE